jgi:plastocyanin
MHPVRDGAEAKTEHAPGANSLVVSTRGGSLRRTLALALVALVAVALIAAAVGQAASDATKTLKGTVGPGFTISMAKKKVVHGKFKITISDKSNIHNFHLTGPGVNKSTSVSGTGTVTWTVTLKKGKTYKFVCDPHASSMKGTLKVT